MANPQAEMIRILREEQQAFREEQLHAQQDQQGSWDDMTRVLEMVREIVMAVARMEKLPTELETLAVAASKACTTTTTTASSVSTYSHNTTSSWRVRDANTIDDSVSASP